MAANTRYVPGGKKAAPASTVASTEDESWKSQAFLNIGLRRKNGSVMKLEKGGLKLSNVDHAYIIDLFTSGKITNEQFAAKLVVDFRTLERKEGSELDL